MAALTNSSESSAAGIVESRHAVARLSRLVDKPGWDTSVDKPGWDTSVDKPAKEPTLETSLLRSLPWRQACLGSLASVDKPALEA